MTTANDSHQSLPHAARLSPRENFPVLSIVVGRALRVGFAAVYSFCRASDDIADDPSQTPAQRLESLRRWRDELERCFNGHPRLPILIKLREAAERYSLPAEPFHRLLDAFEQDQVCTRYETWGQLVRYASRSADPVGELVLRIGGHSPNDANWSRLIDMSNDTCTALQFVNFWQDVRRDLLELDRVYLPLQDIGISFEQLVGMANERASSENASVFRDSVEPLVERTDHLMRCASDLPNQTARSLARPVRLFQCAGLLVSERIRAARYATLWRRPRVSRRALVRLTLAAMFRPARNPA